MSKAVVGVVRTTRRGEPARVFVPGEYLLVKEIALTALQSKRRRAILAILDRVQVTENGVAFDVYALGRRGARLGAEVRYRVEGELAPSLSERIYRTFNA